MAVGCCASRAAGAGEDAGAGAGAGAGAEAGAFSAIVPAREECAA